MSTPELRLGLIGCGTVGSAFLNALRDRHQVICHRTGARLRVDSVAVAHPDRPRAVAEGIPVHGDAAAIAADGRISIVVEASGAPEADRWLLTALDRGAVVITAHKQALAQNPQLLERLARHDLQLYCEGAVAAAVPIVRNLRSSLSCDEVEVLRGVLNGTTNFILSRAEGTASFVQALEEARSLGYAEANPVADLSGGDAAAKLAILATLAWRQPLPLSEIDTQGIDEAVVEEAKQARLKGQRIKLVARAWRNGGLQGSVGPEHLDERDLLATASGVESVVQVRSALAGELFWRGPGAGGMATASALLADVVDGARFLNSQISSRRSYASAGC